MTKAKNPVILIIIVIIVIIGLFWFFNRETETASAIYETDTTLSGDSLVPANEIHAIKDGAVLTIDGNFTVEGDLECRNGAIYLVVNGDLNVSGQLTCQRDEELPENDLAQGILIVVSGNVEFSSDAIVATNGHIQIVDNLEKIAATQAAIDEIFADAGADTGDGPRVGPFIPIELAPGQEEAFLPSILSPTAVKVSKSDNGLLNKLNNILIHQALAADPAVDIDGNPVRRTVKIGGKWVIGHPNLLPPFDINIPTPPKGIKKIIVVYDFGPGADVNVVDLNLAGPDGRPGTSDEGASCNAKGSKGEDAFRLNVRANNITVNNFTLRMGNGGDGGSAVSQINCDPGVAVGGPGGEPGNIKMQSTGTFKILGQFKIIPGVGGFGGEAIAAGKTGADGCPAENGGEAKATGGQGGDNKKGLKTINVEGLSNVTIEPLFAGRGGNAIAHAGDGGNGAGPSCAGGNGAKATATGGKGGTATSRTVQSTGGDGGDAEANSGNGGKGGTGTIKDPGGNGGKGGDAIASGGKAGTGRTGNGAEGAVLNESGGDGGDGGDGCPEGKGGNGGQGNPVGKNGVDGKNICPPVEEKKVDVKVGEDVEPVEPEDDDGGATASDDSDIVLPELIPLEIIPMTLSKKHLIGESSCPDPLGSVSLTGPTGHWRMTVPAGWITPPATSGEMIETEIIQLDLQFNCNITDFSTHTEQTRIKIQVTDEYDRTVDSFFDVFMEIELP